MKYSRRYVIYAAVLLILFILQFHIFDLDSNQVGEFRGAVMTEDIWNPIIAENVNSHSLHLIVDNKEYTEKKYSFYMNDQRDIMVPVEILTEAFKCSAGVYDQNRLFVQKYLNKIQVMLDQSEAYVDDFPALVRSPLTMVGDKYFIGINEMGKLLGYDITFDMDTYTLRAMNQVDSTTIVPPVYDPRLTEKAATIKNQGHYSTCWAFATISALEIGLRPEETLEFSPDHITMCNPYHANQYDGGDYTMGMAYLAAWQGPVYEEQDPYGDDCTDHSLVAKKHVQEMQIIESKDYKAIKEAVFLYGGVQSSLYCKVNGKNSSNDYYNKDTSAYCYIGTEKPNHDILIVGWDDNFPKEYFQMDVEGDGAFICQNSWGENFGEKGYFYVSYYDTTIGTHNIAFTKIEDVNNYDFLYQSDLCGWVGKLGYEAEDVYGANVYTAKERELLCAAGFYATGADTSYEVYVVNNFKDANSLSNRRLVASGKLEKAGYYTVDFDQEVGLTPGERFAVVIYLSTPGTKHPMAIEYDTGSYFLQDVILDDGESYISHSGLKFVNVKEKQECNLCIKAYTRRYE